MRHSDLIGKLTNLAGTARLVSSAASLASRLKLGKIYSGIVQTQVGKGQFVVQVAGQAVFMYLPENTPSGETVNLKVTSIHPQISFMLIPSTHTPHASEQFSAAARIFSILAELPAAKSAPLPDARPIWPTASAVPDPNILAESLREAISTSGLFYESHLANWIQGEYSTQQLLAEPQNTNNRNHGLKPMSFSTSENIPMTAKNEWVNLVQQQLHALEHKHLQWSGQIWPGQTMQWDIQGETQHSTGGNKRQWETDLELTLPILGNIHACLKLSDNGLKLVLDAADPAVSERLRNALPNLQASLVEKGINLTSAIVSV